MYNYDQLNRILKERGISRTQLQKDTGLSSGTIAKIGKKVKLSERSLRIIGEYLNCGQDTFKALLDHLCVPY